MEEGLVVGGVGGWGGVGDEGSSPDVGRRCELT